MKRQWVAPVLVLLIAATQTGCKRWSKSLTPIPDSAVTVSGDGQLYPPITVQGDDTQWQPTQGSRAATPPPAATTTGQGSGSGRNTVYDAAGSGGTFESSSSRRGSDVEPWQSGSGAATGFEPVKSGSAPLPDDSRFVNQDTDRDIFASHTVYFDFDQSVIRPEDAPQLEFIAQHLKSNPADNLAVEGHCDERGTEGYNLALGERRALSAREYIINLGVSGERIKTVSFGEAKPAAPGTTEEAYAKNRRCEFILMTP